MSPIISVVNTIAFPFCILLIGFVCVQALLFMSHAIKFNNKYGLFTKEEIKGAIKSSAVISIGPSLSVMVVVLSLIPLLGSVITFMRCGVIGAADFELVNAKLAMATIGTAFDDPHLTEAAFTVGFFGCTLASAPYFIHLILTCKLMDKMAIKSSQKRRSFLPLLGVSASMGFIGYWAIDTGRRSFPNTTAIITSLAVSYLVSRAAKKLHKLADWNMAISLVCGMIAGTVVAEILATGV